MCPHWTEEYRSNNSRYTKKIRNLIPKLRDVITYSHTILLSPFSTPKRMALEFAEVLMSKNCDLSCKMTTFLSDCGRGVVKKSQVRLIFQLDLWI